MGAELTGGSLLMRSLILRRLLRRTCWTTTKRMWACCCRRVCRRLWSTRRLSLDRRVAVNLNYTVSQEVMQACIDQAGIRHVLTSRKVMEKFGFELNAELVMLEDLRDKVTLADKVLGAWPVTSCRAGC